MLVGKQASAHAPHLLSPVKRLLTIMRRVSSVNVALGVLAAAVVAEGVPGSTDSIKPATASRGFTTSLLSVSMLLLRAGWKCVGLRVFQLGPWPRRNQKLECLERRATGNCTRSEATQNPVIGVGRASV